MTAIPDPKPSPLACALPSDQQTERRLAFAAGLTSLILVAEIVGGVFTHSLALLSDAAHVFTDVFALFLSYLAHRLSRRPPSRSRTYGWHRAEVFAAALNGATLVVIGVGIIREAWERFQAPPAVKAGPMLAVAAAGLIANAIVLLRLGGHSHRDLNLRAAYLHVLGDLLASVGVVVAAVIMQLTGVYLVDPILSALIALAIIFSSVRLLREAMHILLEGVPRGMKLDDVVDALKALPGVIDVHDLHVWSLCSNVHALSAHVVSGPLSDGEREALIAEAESALGSRFGIGETTLQVETSSTEADELLHAAGHETAHALAHPGHNH
jgi:cobalt-zinc-cadmium efflux system protein